MWTASFSAATRQLHPCCPVHQRPGLQAAAAATLPTHSNRDQGIPLRVLQQQQQPWATLQGPHPEQRHQSQHQQYQQHDESHPGQHVKLHLKVNQGDQQHIQPPAVTHTQHLLPQQQQAKAKQQKRKQQKQLQQQQQEEMVSAAARALTNSITSSADASQLLLLLWQHQEQLDAIHVSAAVQRARKLLMTGLQLPNSPEPQQHQAAAAAAQLQWLQHLQLQMVPQQLALLNNCLYQQQQQLQLLPGDSGGVVGHAAGSNFPALLPSHNAHQQQQQHRLQQQQGGDSQSPVQPHPANQWQQQEQQQDSQHILQPYPTEHSAAVQEQQHQEQQQCDLPHPWLLLLLLAQLSQQHAPAMGSQQLCTCLNSFVQLLQQHQAQGLPLLLVQPLRGALQQLLQSAEQQLPGFDPQALSLVLHAAAGVAGAQGGFRPPADFILRWYRASRRQLDHFNCLDLSMSVGALGRMQLFPPAEWMSSFWTCSQAAFPAFQPQELLQLLLGVAGTQRTPPKAWLPAAALQLQTQLPSMTPQQLSTAVFALAKLGYVPSVAWLERFWVAWEAQQTGFTARGHATILWGVGAVKPVCMQQAHWALKVQAALQLAVARAATAVAAVALQKLRHAAAQHQQDRSAQPAPHAELQPAQTTLQHTSSSHNPAPDQPQQLHQQQQTEHPLQQQEQPQLLSSASLMHPTDCAMVLGGIARLGPACLDPAFPAFWLAQSRSQLVNMNSQELSTCLWALGRLRLQVPEAWLQQALQCTAQVAPCMSHRQLAMVLWGCARIRYLPNVLVTAELLMSAAEKLPRFTPHSLALMVWSLGALRMRPNKEWMQLVLDQALHDLNNFDGQDFSGFLLGLYWLRYNPGTRWLDTYVATMATKVQLLTPQQHSRVMAVLRALSYSCDGKAFAWVMDPVAVAAMCDWNTTTSSSSKSVRSKSGSSSSSSGSNGSGVC